MAAGHIDQERMKSIIILLIWLLVAFLSIELSIYGLLYIHFSEMAHGDFWQGNLIAWLILSVIWAFLCGGGIFVGLMEKNK